SSTFGTKPSPISFSSGSSIEYRTSWPSRTTCQAMSPIRPVRETKRNFFLSMLLFLADGGGRAEAPGEPRQGPAERRRVLAGGRPGRLTVEGHVAPLYRRRLRPVRFRDTKLRQIVDTQTA